jgi:hypothetical protein
VAWLSEHPEAAHKNLKPIRSAKLLETRVYYNTGTGVIERGSGAPGREVAVAGSALTNPPCQIKYTEIQIY